MKFTFLALLVAAVGIYYVSHPARPQAPAAHLAPDGTYYLLSYYSTVTPKGLIGWTPGQEVSVDTSKAVKPDFVAVSDGRYSAYLHRSFLTQDMDQAQAVLMADQAAQAQGEALTAQARQQGTSYQLAENMKMAAHVEQANAVQAAASTIGTFNSRLNNGAYSPYGGSYGYTSSYLYLFTPSSIPGTPGTVVGANPGSIVVGDPSTTSIHNTDTRVSMMAVPTAHYSGDHATSRPTTGSPRMTTPAGTGKGTLGVPLSPASTGPGFMAH